MIRRFTNGAFLAICLLMPCFSVADPAEVTVTPATRLSFATESGKFYQLESRTSPDQEWQSDEIRCYVDAHCYQTITKDKWNSEAAPDSETAPFDQPFHLILNLAVDGGFFSGTDLKSDRLSDDAFPQVFEIDYARVFQWAPPQKEP